MDVERTIEYILQMQAKSEEHMARHEAWMAKAEARAVKADERMDKFDKRLEATRKLVEAGMKLIAKRHVEVQTELRLLAAQQRKTERTLDRFLASMTNRPSNGHKA
jgi:hypothetical protein